MAVWTVTEICKVTNGLPCGTLMLWWTEHKWESQRNSETLGTCLALFQERFCGEKCPKGAGSYQEKATVVHAADKGTGTWGVFGGHS